MSGNPDPKYISTSFAERITRLSNAFSKKVEKPGAHRRAALHVLVTSASCTKRTGSRQAAGVTHRLRDVGDIAAIMDKVAPKPGTAEDI